MSDQNLPKRSSSEIRTSQGVSLVHTPSMKEISQNSKRLQSSHEDSIKKSESSRESIDKPGFILSQESITEDLPCPLLPSTNDKWRAYDLNSPAYLNEYQLLLEQVKARTKEIQEVKNISPEVKPGISYVNISKSELAEINYSRLMLEKEVNMLKTRLEDREKEISRLKLNPAKENKEFCEENRGVPLKSLDRNLKNRDGITIKEKNEVQKQLHESLKLNDKLNETIRNLKEQLNSRESENAKLSREIFSSCKNPSRNHRASSSFVSLHQNMSDIENSITNTSEKKNQELQKEVIKYQNDIQEYQKELEILQDKLAGKKNLQRESKMKSEALRAEMSELSEKNVKLLEKVKNFENKSVESRLGFDSKLNEMRLEIEKKTSEVQDLQRNIGQIREEKEELGVRFKDYDELKATVSKVTQSLELSKSSEIKLLEEISILKSYVNRQNGEFNDTSSRLNMIQSLYQSLELDFASLKKAFIENEQKLVSITEKNNKIGPKLEKSKQKLRSFKLENKRNQSEINDLQREYLHEKAHVSKLYDQTGELKFHIQSLETMRDKMIEKIENFTTHKIESLSKIKSLEDQISSLKCQNEIGIKKYLEDYERISLEYNNLKSETRKKNEENIVSRAENRKLFQDKTEANVLLKKCQEQEDFNQKLLKSSEAEIQKITEKLHHSNRQSDEKDLKISQLSSEIYSLKNQLTMTSADLKKVENSSRMLNLENFSLHSKVEELDKIRTQPMNEDTFRDEYYKLLRAYQHLTEDFKALSISVNESKVDRFPSDISLIRRSEKSLVDESCFMNEIEKLQIKLQGVTEEKEIIERKLEFTLREKKDLEKRIEEYREEIRVKEQNSVKVENVMKEAMKYKNETLRLESDQSTLKKELDQALNKLHNARHKTQSLEESLRKKHK